MYNAITNTVSEGVDSEEVEQRITRAQQPVTTTLHVDQQRIYSGITEAKRSAHSTAPAVYAPKIDQKRIYSTLKALKSTSHPTPAGMVVAAQQQTRRVAADVSKLQANAFSTTGTLIYDQAGSGGGIVAGADELTLQSYTPTGPSAEVTIAAGAVTVSPLLQLPGLDSDVATAITDVKTELEHLKIQVDAGEAADALIEAAQSSAIGSLIAKVLVPPGYVPLDPALDPDPDDVGSDEHTQSLDPLTLAPKGTWAQSDGTSFTRTDGRVGLSNGFPTRSFDMRGSFRQAPIKPEDTSEFESTVSLGSKVAVYDSTTLTNPDAVCAKLGTNALVTAAGNVLCQAVEAEAGVSCRLEAVLATNMAVYDTTVTPQVLTNGSDRCVALGTNAYTSVDGGVYSSKAVVSGALTASTINGCKPQRTVHASVLPDVNRKVAQARIETQRAKRKLGLIYPDDSRKIGAAKTAAVSAHRRIKVSVAKDYSRPIAAARVAAIAAQRRVKPLVSKDYAPAVAAAKTVAVSAQRRVKPLVSKDYGPAVASAKTAAIVAQRRIRAPLLHDVRAYAARLFARVTQSTSDGFAQAMRRIKPDIALHAAVQRAKVWCLNMLTTGTVTMSNKTLIAPVVTGGMAVTGQLVCSDTPTRFDKALYLNQGAGQGPDTALRFWSNSSWGMYISQGGAAGVSMANAVPAQYGDVTGYAIRFRVANSSTSGFMFENASEQGLLALSGTGHMWLKGNLTVGGDLLGVNQMVMTSHNIDAYVIGNASGKAIFANTTKSLVFTAKGTQTVVTYNGYNGFFGGSGVDTAQIRPSLRVGTGGGVFITSNSAQDCLMGRSSTGCAFTNAVTIGNFTTVAGQSYTFGIEVLLDAGANDSFQITVGTATVGHSP